MLSRYYSLEAEAKIITNVLGDAMCKIDTQIDRYHFINKNIIKGRERE